VDKEIAGYEYDKEIEELFLEDDKKELSLQRFYDEDDGLGYDECTCSSYCVRCVL
jgi:hypothetical protein